MELTPDGRTLVAACSEPILRSWDVRTGRELRPLAGHEETVAFVRLSRDGRSAVSFGSDRTLRTWDVKTGKEISRLPRDKSDKLTEVFAAADFAALSPDGKLLAARVKNPPGKPAAFTVLLFDLASGKELHRLPGHEPWLVGAEFTPDGRTLVTWDDEQVVRLWDVATGEKSKQYSLAEGKQTPRPIPGRFVL